MQYGYVKAKKLKKYFFLDIKDEDVIKLPVDKEEALNEIFAMGGLYSRFIDFDKSEEMLEEILKRSVKK